MEKLKMHSPNLTDESIAKVREILPGCVTEAKDENGQVRYAVDFDQLRQELSDHIVEGPQERYHLNWPGKREALLAANAPIAKTLRPCREESVEFDTTKNLFIEGDNLEVLKLIQETYLGRIAMIYIDPPYNTGSDFIYRDDFSEDEMTYLEKSLQTTDGGKKLIANPEYSGRFHSNWLSEIYPRLRVCKNLLKADGVLAISIDDNEISNLLSVVDEVFGWANRKVICIKMSESSGLKMGSVKKFGTVPKLKEYVVLCSKGRIQGLQFDGIPKEKWDSEYNIFLNGLTKADRQKIAEVQDENGAIVSIEELDEIGARIQLQSISEVFRATNRPTNQKESWCFENSWRICQCATSSSVLKLAKEKAKSNKNAVFFVRTNSGLTYPVRSGFSRESSKPRVQLIFADDNATLHPGDLWTDIRTTGLDGEGGVTFKNGKKPLKLLKRLLKAKTAHDDIVLDFYAGSGSFGHACLELNAEDGGNRRFILVQLAEELEGNQDDQVASRQFCIDNGLKPNVAELCKERLRRSGARILNGDVDRSWERDIGFRVLNVDSSNMADVYYSPGELKQDDLLSAIDNIKPDRNNPEDLLFQVLVDWGVDLTLPIRSESIQGKTVFFVNKAPYDLMACFDRGITEELVKKLAKHEPMRMVFRDNGFVSDSVKINVDQIFRQLFPATEVKSI